MSELQYVTEKDFQGEVLDSLLPVLVDFTAAWCAPCKTVDPIVQQLAGEWGDKVKVVKCDADKNPKIVVQFGVMGLPTLMLFKGGVAAERVTGYQPKDKINARFSHHF